MLQVPPQEQYANSELDCFVTYTYYFNHLALSSVINESDLRPRVNQLEQSLKREEEKLKKIEEEHEQFQRFCEQEIAIVRSEWNQEGGHLQNLEVRVEQEEDDGSSELESDSDPWDSESTSGLESELESTSGFEDSKLESTSAFGDGELENLSDVYDSLFTHYESAQFLPQPTWDLTNFQFQIL